MIRVLLVVFIVGFVGLGLMSLTFAQELPPAPSEPKPIKVPAFRETVLDNGLRVSVVEKRDVPLVSIRLVVRGGGASVEEPEKAGLASMTAELLTKGTKTRTAEQIAEEIEFLGGDISSSADWNAAYLSLSVASDKLDKAMPIFADVALNPTFRQKEIEILRSQLQDELTYNLKQPSFLASYVASVYAFNEHPAGGTPESLKNISRNDIVSFYKKNFLPNNSVLVVVGDISFQKAVSIAKRFFGRWAKQNQSQKNSTKSAVNLSSAEGPKFLIVDLPKSGQAAVFYASRIDVNRADRNQYFQSQVMNSILGGGFSSRLNQEIRVKRGLSYGAGSSFSWRAEGYANFIARAQTKNESAAEVAELMLEEIKKLAKTEVPDEEMKPRKAALIGNLARQIETCQGLSFIFSQLYSLGVSPDETKTFVEMVEKVSKEQIKQFTAKFFNGANFVVVGDYSIMKEGFAKRFPKAEVTVVQADEINSQMRQRLGLSK